MSAAPIGVVVADDRQMVREGFRAILDSQPDIEVVGEAGNGVEAVRLCQLLRPQVCLLDIRMPEMDGLEATRQLQNLGDRAPGVVIVTTFDLDEYVFEAFRNGARGFITKDSGATLLLEAVRAAASGDALVSPDITLRLIQQVTRRHRRGKPDRTLSTRELALLRAVASGLTNEEIAASLYLSLSTVKSGITSLLTHIGARNRVELTIYAYEHGIVEDQL